MSKVVHLYFVTDKRFQQRKRGTFFSVNITIHLSTEQVLLNYRSATSFIFIRDQSSFLNLNIGSEEIVFSKVMRPTTWLVGELIIYTTFVIKSTVFLWGGFILLSTEHYRTTKGVLYSSVVSEPVSGSNGPWFKSQNNPTIFRKDALPTTFFIQDSVYPSFIVRKYHWTIFLNVCTETVAV